jgi:leader peptidase (prepilin peptidase)/N-methyltransferase
MALAIAFAAVGGLIVGSFLNVVIHRLPLGESLTHPRSRCPSCGTQLRAIDNIPVVSWLALRGKCHHCGAPVSARYPLVELTTGVLYAAVVASQDDAVRIVLGLLLVTALVPIALIDLDHRIIPNKLMLVGTVVSIAIVLLTQPDSLTEHLIAAAGAGGFLLIAALAYPAGMGMGDVKLAGVMGLFLGRAVGPAMFVALISGSVVGALIIARKGAKEGRKTAIPFGPYLAFGGLVGLFAGDVIVDWYLDTFV